jgi:F1F0 ATPase subunit 2
MILRFAGGALLGLFFYGGLWLTLRSLATTHHPLIVTMGSLFLRMAITLAGFFVLIRGHWENAVTALVGFTAVRLLLPRQRSRRCS